MTYPAIRFPKLPISVFGLYFLIRITTSLKFNMEENNITERMQEKGVKPTSNRILIMKTLIKESRPMSLSDIEETLPTMDKSSIFRVLSIFLKHHIVHSFEDGRGILNYELCTHRGICNNSEAHIHFYCKLCHKSFCMKDIPMQD